MPKLNPWTNSEILFRLEAAEASLIIAKQAAVAWKAGKLPFNESPASHVIGSNAVEAGIAAADVICELQLKKHNTSHNHNDAIQLLKQVDHAASDILRDLIDVKNSVQYSPAVITIQEATLLVNQARDLYDNARRRAAASSFPVKPQSPRPL